MMTNPKPTRTLIKQAIARCDEKLAAWQGDRNPQVIEMSLRVQGEKMAFEAVLAHLRGNNFDLNLYAKELV